MTIINQDKTRDFINSLLAFWLEGDDKETAEKVDRLPCWEQEKILASFTGSMIDCINYPDLMVDANNILDIVYNSQFWKDCVSLKRGKDPRVVDCMHLVSWSLAFKVNLVDLATTDTEEELAQDVLRIVNYYYFYGNLPMARLKYEAEHGGKVGDGNGRPCKK